MLGVLKSILRRRVLIAAIVCLPLAAISALSCIVEIQCAVSTSTGAVGLIAHDGYVCVYTARHYMGTFRRRGLYIQQPIDDVLDRGSIWSQYYRRGYEYPEGLDPGTSYPGEHGIAWNFLNVPPRLLFIGGLYPIAMVSEGAFATRRKRRREARYAHRCRRCRYDLTGNVSGVCPECGMRVGA